MTAPSSKKLRESLRRFAVVAENYEQDEDDYYRPKHFASSRISSTSRRTISYPSSQVS